MKQSKIASSFGILVIAIFGCSKPPTLPAKDTAHIHETCFSESLYEVDICYLIGGSVADLRAYVKQHHGEKAITLSWDQPFVLEDGTDAYQFHVTSPLGEDERFYVWMHDPTPRLIWHETMHVTFDILFVRQVYYKSESEEAFAYLGGWIFEEAQKRGVRP